MLGSLVGTRFRLERLLGSGGMGSVYEAVHTTTGRRVAVKLLQGSGVDAEPAARLEREARAGGLVASQHIAQVLDAGRDPETGQPFLAMELLVGEDLQALLQRLGPLPPALVLRLAAQACLGLMAAHAADIVHRDIKPANLFLAASDAGARVLKVLDFGIARVKMERLQHESAGDLTRSGSLLGSPHYMSPEQARGLRSIDHRSDVWSLGVVMYKLLTGQPPHRRGEGGLGELLISICCLPPPPLQDLAPWVPDEVAAVVHGALQLDPSGRYPGAEAMLAAITPLLPAGHAIDAAMLRGLTDDERSVVAPRHVVLRAASPLTPGADATAALTSSADATAQLSSGAGATASLTSGARSTTSLTSGVAVTASTPPDEATLGLTASILVTSGATISAAPVVAQATVAPVAAADSPGETAVRAPRRWLVVVPVALGVVVALVGWRMGEARQGAATVAHDTPALGASAREELPRPSPTVVLRVRPATARVEVDGAMVVADPDGSVVLVGTLGSLHQVRIRQDTREALVAVAISEAGAVPSEVRLPDAPAAAPAARASGAARAPSVASAAPRKRGKLVTAFE